MLLSQVHEVEEARGFCDYPQSNSSAFTSHGKEWVDETPPKRVRVACDHCDEGSSSADSYCVECDKKLCSRHEKVSEEKSFMK